MNFSYTQLQYAGAALYFALCVFIAALLVWACWTFFPSKNDPEKLSSYECGFIPYDDARARFDVHFYMISLLFLIFDLEVIFLIPWVMGMENLAPDAFAIGALFVTILVLGFLYEWWIGAFDMFEIKLW